jgi:hypothetical protein
MLGKVSVVLVASFSSQRPGFEPRSVRVGSVVGDNVALGQVFF